MMLAPVLVHNASVSCIYCLHAGSKFWYHFFGKCVSICYRISQKPPPASAKYGFFFCFFFKLDDNLSVFF